MRFILRITVRITTWAFAAIGAKALYERYSPKARELRQPVGEVLDTAKTEAAAVTQHAKAAVSEVGGHAKTAASTVVAEAKTKIEETSDPGLVGEPPAQSRGFQG